MATRLPGSSVHGPSAVVAQSPGPPARREDGAEPAQRAAGQSRPISEQELSRAVKDLNTLVQDVRRELHFSIDEHTGRTVIKVIDSATKKVVRQIPPEQILNLVKAFQQSGTSGMLNVTA